MTNTCCCVYSVETPNDGQICPKHVLYQNKFEKQCISLVFIIRRESVSEFPLFL